MSLIGGLFGAYGSKKAADAQKDAARSAAQVQQYMFDQSQLMQQPWAQTGAGALAQLAGLYGIAPINYMGAGAAPGASAGAVGSQQPVPGSENYLGLGANANTGTSADVGQYAGATPAPQGGFGQYVPNDAMAAFYTSPGYQFRMDEGLKALGGMASALGQRGHGATAADVMRYSQGLASDEFNQYANRLAALAGVGQTTAGNMGNQALMAGQGLADSRYAVGNARASGILGIANSINNSFSDAARMFGMFGMPPGGG